MILPQRVTIVSLFPISLSRLFANLDLEKPIQPLSQPLTTSPHYSNYPTTDQHPAESSRSALESPWSNYPGSSVQQWSEHPKLVRGSLAGGRLKPVKNERGEIDELEWDHVVKQDQDLRVRTSAKNARRLVEPSILIEGEAEYFDLVGDPLSFTSDAHLLSGLNTALPELPLHPTIYLNTHFASHPPPSTSRIMSTLEPTYPNRGNCLATSEIDQGEGTSTQGLVWRMGDERYKRPNAVGWGYLNHSSTGSRKGKAKATDQDASPSSSRSFVSSTSPRIFSHHTPIHQLSLAPLSPSHTLLGIRSHTSLDLVHLALPTPFDPGKPEPLELSRYTYTLPRSQIADFALGGINSGYGQVGSGLIVDTSGSLFGFGLTQETRLKGTEPRPELFQLRKGTKLSQKGYSGFSRVAYGSKQNEAIVAVEDQVLLYDLRSPTSSLELVGSDLLSRYSNQPSVVTSLLERSQDQDRRGLQRSTTIHAVCTTREVVWVDERMTGRRGCEVLRWDHERVGVEGKGFDRTSSILEFPPLEQNLPSTGSSVQRIALHSRQTPQITILTTSLTPSSAPQSLLDPYDLSSPAPSTDKDRFNRVGLSISAIRDHEPQEESEEEEGGDDDYLNEEEKRKNRFLRKMVRQEERERGRDGKKGWRLVEVGMTGEVYEREIFDGIRGGGEEEEDSVADAQDSKGEVIRLREEKEIELVRLDMSAVVEALGEDQLVGDEEEGRRTEGDQALEMLKKVVEESREIEGDVGALTAFELLDLATSLDPVTTPQSDSEEEDAQMVDRPTSTPGIEPHPRPTSFVPDKARPLLSSSLSSRLPRLDSLLSSFSQTAASSIRPFDTFPHSRFNAFAPFPFSLQSTLAQRANHLRQTFNIDDSPSPSPSSLACDQVAVDLTLSSTILLPRMIEPDEPTDTPNQPQPATEDPPPLHLSYLRPIVSDLNYSDDDSEPTLSYNSRRNQRKKPTLNGKGARLLLAEWHIGSDPRSYTWSNPYEGEKATKEDDFSQTQSQSQRKKNRKKRGGGINNEDSQFASSQPPAFSQSQSRFEFPSSFPSSSQSYFPSLVGASRPPPPPQPPSSSQSQGQSQDWNQAASTQPIISITGPGSETQSQSQVGGAWGGAAASQIVPGAFGARQVVGASKKEKDKKKAKKRVSGF